MPRVSDTSRLVRLFIPRSVLNSIVSRDSIRAGGSKNEDVCLVFRMVGGFTGGKGATSSYDCRQSVSDVSDIKDISDDLETQLSKEHARRNG